MFNLLEAVPSKHRDEFSSRLIPLLRPILNHKGPKIRDPYRRNASQCIEDSFQVLADGSCVALLNPVVDIEAALKVVHSQTVEVAVRSIGPGAHDARVPDPLSIDLDLLRGDVRIGRVLWGFVLDHIRGILCPFNRDIQ
jgi:hypothetical protein